MRELGDVESVRSHLRNRHRGYRRVHEAACACSTPLEETITEKELVRSRQLAEREVATQCASSGRAAAYWFTVSKRFAPAARRAPMTNWFDWR